MAESAMAALIRRAHDRTDMQLAALAATYADVLVDGLSVEDRAVLATESLRILRYIEVLVDVELKARRVRSGSTRQTESTVRPMQARLSDSAVQTESALEPQRPNLKIVEKST